VGNKLAVLALVLAGCVAEDATTSTSSQIEGGAVGSTGAEVEFPSVGPDHVNPDLVVITGLEIPGRQPTQVHIDVSNGDVADAEPQVRELGAAAAAPPQPHVCPALVPATGARLQVRGRCAAAAELPQTNVGASLCTGSGAAARLIGDTSPTCNTTRCELAGGVVVTVDACVD